MDRPADRAVSEVIGAIVLFGFLTIAFTLYQGVVVPNQQAAIEFEHNEQVHGHFLELRNAIKATGMDGPERSVSIRLGAPAPTRVLAINPGTGAGSLNTEGLGTITVRNLSATDSETGDYIGDTNTTLGPFETAAIVYRPAYTFYEQAPVTRYEHGLAYNQFPNGAESPLAGQVVINGRNVRLIALAGNVSAARSGSVTVDTVALSSASRAISVTDSGGAVTIRLPSRLSAATWTELLSDEYDPNGTRSDQFVSAIRSPGPDEVAIVLEPGVTYDLELAKVGLGTGIVAPTSAYIVDVAGNETGLPEEGIRKLVVEVRDRYNNPVSNVSVSATITVPANPSDPAEGVSPASETTQADGRAAFTYTAPNQVKGSQTVSIELTFARGVEPAQTAVFELTVMDIDGTG